jgi:hypothetical protein
LFIFCFPQNLFVICLRRAHFVRFFCLPKTYLFISFVRPKEMNQRKGRRKCQLKPKRAPATLALLALPFCLKFAPFPDCPRSANYRTQQKDPCFRILNGHSKPQNSRFIAKFSEAFLNPQFILPILAPLGGPSVKKLTGR